MSLQCRLQLVKSEFAKKPAASPPRVSTLSSLG